MIGRRLLRIKVIKALYCHLKSDGDSLIVSQKNLLFSINKSYELYHLMLHLIVDVSDHAQGVIEIGQKKLRPTEEEKNPNTRFVSNRVIEQIRNSRSLNEYLGKKSLSWVNYPDLIKKLYTNLVESEYYVKYMSAEKSSYNDDKNVVLSFFTNEIEDFEPIYETLEEMSIYWIDEIEFVLGQAIKTIRSIKPVQVSEGGNSDISLMPMYKDSDDLDFVKDLFAKSIIKHKDNLQYIERFTVNWNIDRIAAMDRIILLVALVELTDFPTIPIKVTLDEYIELSKYYSSPNSGFFINGILDNMIEDLRKNGKINKEGRGLVE